MKASLPRVALCSTCGATMTPTGECLLCLIRSAFDAPEEELLATTFGDYEIARREDGSLWELGRGAMGVTYRAEDKLLKRSVALKVVAVPSGNGAEQKVRDRFLREARAAASLRDRNIAGVFHFGATADGRRCYYAMELVEGETLEALVRREGPMPVEAALEMAVQVTHALIAAAGHSLVHRDLKPGNIMLAGNGHGSAAELEVKVIDFGLAKALTGNATEMDLTQGCFLGTPAFASPEQFSGAPADARSDIYSLGVTLWYALTGEVPYEGKTIEEIRRGQAELALPLEKLVARKIPKAVIELLRRILALTPAERPASARELMRALKLCRERLGHTLVSPLHGKLSLLAAFILIAAVTFFAFRQGADKKPARDLASAKSIAILPFQNIPDDKDNAYLADGIHEEILTTLAQVADLKVISRTSVMQFRDAGKRNLREISQQLGVAHVLEGSVQRSGNRVRVTAQLIDARTDSHIWADRYDGDLADVFTIQSEIAQKIAVQLRATLSADEQTALRTKPSPDPAAYELYLRAREIWRDRAYAREALEKQVALLDQAVKRDPGFVQALCRLAELHLAAYWFDFDHTSARLELAQKAIEAAARLRPDEGEVHLARGIFHYYAHRDYSTALAELAQAGAKLPNNTDVLFFTGLIQRRMGRWEESNRSFERGLSPDPLSANLSYVLSENYSDLRRYDDARRVIDNVLVWKPRDFVFQCLRVKVDLDQNADLDPLRRLMAQKPTAPNQNQVRNLQWWLAYWQRDYRAAAEVLAEYDEPDFSWSGVVTPREYYEGRTIQGLGDTSGAEAAFVRARDRAALATLERPSDGRALMVLAEIDAHLGRKENAISEAERAANFLPVAADRVDGLWLQLRLAAVYSVAGESDRALAVLEQIAPMPGGPSYGDLQLDRDFDPLRSDPRFQKIVAALAPKTGS